MSELPFKVRIQALKIRIQAFKIRIQAFKIRIQAVKVPWYISVFFILLRYEKNVEEIRLSQVCKNGRKLYACAAPWPDADPFYVQVRLTNLTEILSGHPLLFQCYWRRKPELNFLYLYWIALSVLNCSS